MAGHAIVPSSLRQSSRALRQQQYRSFTSTCHQRASGAADGSSSMNLRGALMRHMGKQRSMQSQMAKMKKGEFPDDVGLLPELLVKPVSKDLPAVLSGQWKRRLQIEWKAFVQTFSGFLSLYYTTRWSVKKDPITKKKNKQPMYLGDRYETARSLHRQLYEAIASGDRKTIEKIACNGLRKQITIKLDHRRAANLPVETWNIKYKGWTGSPKTSWPISALWPARFKSTRIIADRTSAFPIMKDTSIRQVIVEIKSTQTLDKHNGQGPKTADKREYVVIQKFKIDKDDGDWKIWGTIQPSTPQEISELLDTSANVTQESLWEKVRDRWMGATSSAPPP